MVVLGYVNTCSLYLSWAASVGWLNRSMLPLPNCVMSPRDKEDVKYFFFLKGRISNSLTISNFGINAAASI